jgi:hypothetical protein
MDPVRNPAVCDCSITHWSWLWFLRFQWSGIYRARTGVTGQQGMLTPPGHLIPTLMFPGVCVRLILNAFRFNYLIWAYWFWLRFFPFTWLDALIVTVECYVYLIWAYWFCPLNFAFEMGLMACMLGWEKLLTLSRHMFRPEIYPDVFLYPILCISYWNYGIDVCYLFPTFSTWASPKRHE